MIKHLLFGKDRSYPMHHDLALTFLRAFAGLALALAHGMGKMPPKEGFVAFVGQLGFPSPILFAWAASLTEFLGGIFLAIGLLTRPSAFFIAFTMAVAAFGAHAKDPFSIRELALFYGVTAIAFLFISGGRFSLDHLIRRRIGKIRK